MLELSLYYFLMEDKEGTQKNPKDVLMEHITKEFADGVAKVGVALPLAQQYCEIKLHELKKTLETASVMDSEGIEKDIASLEDAITASHSENLSRLAQRMDRYAIEARNLYNEGRGLVMPGDPDAETPQYDAKTRAITNLAATLLQADAETVRN